MSLTALEKIQAKYDDVEERGQTNGQSHLKSWKDSEAVVMLSAFIKEYRECGFSVEQTRKGDPVLCFSPGLESKEKDSERFELAEHAMFLMDQARKNLKELIYNGVLSFPENEEL